AAHSGAMHPRSRARGDAASGVEQIETLRSRQWVYGDQPVHVCQCFVAVDRTPITTEPSPMKRFLDLADYPRDQIKDILGLAARLQQHPQPQALAGKVLGLLFLNPSLRTLASFQSAVMRLGGTVVVITPGQGTWQMETRAGAIMNGTAAEHVREAVPVLASYCDAMGIRMFAEGRNLAA